MKLWKKAVLWVLPVFMVGLVAIMGIVISRSTELEKQVALDASVRESDLIGRSVTQRLNSVEKYYRAFNADNLRWYLSAYGDYYAGQGVYLRFALDGQTMYDSLPEGGRDMELPADGARYDEHGGRLYLCAVSQIPLAQGALQMFYVKDVDALAQNQRALTQISLGISLLVCGLIAAVLAHMMRRLTKPLDTMGRAAAEIALGDYAQRVSYSGNDELGEFAASFNAMTDAVQDRVRALTEMSAERQAFIDNLAHELRTPITAILGYGEYLKLARASRDEQLAAIDYIIDQSKHVKTLSEKLLILSGMRAESMVFQPVNLDNVIRAALNTFRQPIADKKIDLRVSLKGVPVEGDADLLQSLMQNLFENALRASAPGGRIEVEALCAEGEPSVMIRDYGIGIAEEEQARIFEPFYRVDRSRSRVHGGAGLGLALCRRICQLHGAQLRLRSAVGSGTEVQVIFTTLIHPCEDVVPSA